MSSEFNDLRNANQQRGIEWSGKENTIENLEFCTIEIAGECGELADAVKKLMRTMRGMKNKGLTTEQCKQMIADEIGDVIISTDRLAECLSLNLWNCTKNKFNKTSEQHGFKTKL